MLLALRSLAWTVTVALTGVSASAGTGSVTIDVTVPVTGVVATANVGSVTCNSDFSVSGVSSTCATGTFRIDVDFTVGSVLSTGAIGDVTVDTSNDITVDVSGVSASCAIGSVTFEGVGGGGNFGFGEPLRTRRARPKVHVLKPIEPPKPEPARTVYAVALCHKSTAAVGNPTFDVETSYAFNAMTLRVLKPSAVIDTDVTIGATAANLMAGTAIIETVVDLTDEEILAIMEAA